MVAPHSHAAVVEALEANQWEHFRLLAFHGGAEWQDDGEVVWTVTGVPVAALNGVLRTRLAPGRVGDALDAVTATLDSRGAPWSWYVGPASLPLELADHLSDRGFTVIDVLPGMAAPLDPSVGDPPPAAAGLRFEEVREEPALEAFGTLLGVAFAMPPLVLDPMLRMLEAARRSDESGIRNFITFDGGEPVACGSLLLAEGVAGLYNIGVLPDRQGTGVGTAMTAALMGEARAAGAETGILWSSVAGLQCYRRLGFEERCRLTLYSRG